MAQQHAGYQTTLRCQLQRLLGRPRTVRAMRLQRLDNDATKMGWTCPTRDTVDVDHVGLIRLMVST